MRSKPFYFAILATFVIMSVVDATAQRSPKYSYAAQSRFIPKEIGRVYIGMPLRDFAKQIDLSRANILNDRMSEIRLDVPFTKGNVAGLSVQIAGFPIDGRSEMLTDAKTTIRQETGEEFEIDVKRLRLDRIPASAFVYVYLVTYKSDFDLKAHVTKTFGKGTVRDPNDQYHFSDIEWTKRTSDGLTWLIRSLHENDARQLMLYGRIKGTEWGLE